jgi:hypothetical protein
MLFPYEKQPPLGSGVNPRNFGLDRIFCWELDFMYGAKIAFFPANPYERQIAIKALQICMKVFITNMYERGW